MANRTLRCSIGNDCMTHILRAQEALFASQSKRLMTRASGARSLDDKKTATP